MTTLEKEIEAKLGRMIKGHGGLCLKWVCPGWAGVPDRIILLPGGLVIFAEVKRPTGGKIGKLQTWWRSKLRALGFEHYFIHDETDIAILADAADKAKEATERLKAALPIEVELEREEQDDE